MLRTKLITLLQSLSSREIKQWERFMASNYLVTHRQQKELCTLLLAYAPSFEHPELNKNRLFARIYGEKTPFDELKINNLLSDTYEALLYFLALEQFTPNGIPSKLRTVMALIQKNQLELAQQELKKIRVLMDKTRLESGERIRMELEYWKLAEQLLHQHNSRTNLPDLEVQANLNDQLFVLEKLRMACAMLSRNSLAVMQANYSPNFLPEIIQWCTTNPLLANDDAIQVYLLALRLIEAQEAPAYAAFLEKMQQVQRVFAPSELAELYQYALNYCIKCINVGQSGSYHQALNLYQLLLEQGVLLRNGHLSQWTFKNITTTGLRSGAFEWTEQFLQKYKHTLAETERENAFTFNYAALCYEKKDYATALQTLQNVEFTDFTYHLGAKIIQIKCFYLLQEYYALFALIEATQQLIRRNKSLSDFGKKANLNFLKWIKQIGNWTQNETMHKPSVRQSKRRDMCAQIQQTTPLANKEWLLDLL